VEIYQNCNIFNDGAFDVLKDPETRDEFGIHLEHGQPVRWGNAGQHGIVRAPETGRLLVVDDVTDDTVDRLLVHDAHSSDPSTAFALSRLQDASLARTPFGVFRDVRRPAYGAMVADQRERAVATQGAGDTDDALASLLAGGDTWTVGETVGLPADGTVGA
jgi:2-oxoglutarate ferredoxin oxidoreductase subunit beta